MSFDFIKVEADRRREFKQKYPEIHNFEKKVIDKVVDKNVNKLVKKMGWRKANWLGLTWTLIAF